MLRTLSCAALVASSAAFAPALPTTRAVRRTSKTTVEVLPALAAAGQLAVGLPTMYALFSVNEYVTHRYYQHNELGKWGAYKAARKAGFPKLDGGGHVEHHAETYDDMSLKLDDAQWMATAPAQRLSQGGDKWRGTAFTWQVTAMMIAQCIPTVYPVFHLLGWSLQATTALYVPCMLLHGLVWNALHPDMHGCPEVPVEVGLPSSVLAGLRGSALFDALYENHQGHHVASGRANYNVCCPGTDQIVGSYLAPEAWQPRMRAKTVRAIDGALSAAEM